MRTTREILFIIIVLFPMALIGQTTYYVSNSGNDTTEGTDANNPWQTLNKVNQTSFKPGDKILFNRGDSWEGTLIPNSSGTSGNPITYGAYGSGDKPKIYGSKKITGWTNHSGNIWKATFNKGIEQLFINGERMRLARYPNSGYSDITSTSSSKQFTSAEISSSINYTGASWIGRTSAFTVCSQIVTASNGQTITLDGSPELGIGTGEGFILTNKLEFLDQAGEWYYDTSTNTVYLWAPNGGSPSNYTVRGAIEDYCVYFLTKNYVEIQDLDLRHSNHAGISVNNSDYITLDNNSISGCDKWGIYNFSSASSDLKIRNNKIQDISNTGIRSYSNNSEIINNEIVNVGLLSQFNKTALGQNVGTGIHTRNHNMTINYNRITNVGYDGINFWGNNTEVKYNYIENSMSTLGDGGAIYTYAGSDVNGTASEGSVVMYNIINGCFGNADGYTNNLDNAHGIYMDDGIDDVTIQYNTILHAADGIFYHLNRNNTAEFNTVYDCNIGLSASGEHGDSYFRNNIVFAASRNAISLWWGNSHQRMTKNDSASPVYNNNTYIHHYASDDQFNNSYNFSEWKSKTGQDSNSTFDNSPLAQGETEQLFYNDTKKDKTISLGNFVYRDIDGKEVSGSITLKPFTSIILIKTTSQDETNINNVPSISDQSFNVETAKSAGDFIGQVSATDSDENQTLTFSIVGRNDDNLFTIDSSSGTITANTEISLTSDQTFVLTAQVADDASSPLTASAEITINVKSTAPSTTPDSTLPIVTSFSIPSTSGVLTVPINSFSATDNNTITGYLLTESATTPAIDNVGWSSSSPANYTFAQEGTQTLYAWVMDASGNISNEKEATTLISLPDLSPNYSEYLFEEISGLTAIDTHGSNDGTIVNEEIRVEGRKGKGLELSGTGYINLGESFGNNIQDEITISTWIKPNIGGNNYQGIVMHGGPDTDNFALYIHPGLKGIGFKTSGTTSAWTSIDNVTSLWNGEWHHLAVTYDGVSKIIYLDNQLLLKVDAAGLIDSGEGYNLYIGAGRDEASPTLLYEGQIDEVRIYNYALTSSEIAALYNIAKEEESVVEENSAPSITNQTFIVEGGMSINDVIGQIVASDSDESQTISYSIADGNFDNLFAIDSSTGEIFANKTFAPDADQTVALTVLVTDDAASPLSSSAKITIEIKKAVEINQSPVVYNQAFEIEGNFEINDLIGQIVAYDPNGNQILTYSIVSGNSDGLFTVDQTTGEILASYDFITTTPIQSNFVVEIKDNGVESRSSQATITVNITALQLNHSPIISDQVFKMPTDISVNDLIGQIVASDSDVQQTLSFGIIQGNEDNLFRINDATGKLYLNSIIPADTKGTMSIVVEVKDNAATPLSAYATILLTLNKIIEINNRPVAENITLEIEANTPVSTPISQVIASDLDIDQTLSYQIIQGNEAGMFSINSTNGELIVSSALVAQTYALIVRVEDNAPEPLATDVYVTINVLPKEIVDNENPPAVVSNQTPVISNQHFEVRKSDRIGDVVGQVTASDPDLDQTLAYAIIQGNEDGFFNINPSTGEVYLAASVSQTNEHDILLVVEATDNAESPRSASATITVNVLINGKIVRGEINDNNHRRIILYFDEPLQTDNLKSSQIKSDFILSHDKIVQQVSIDGNQIHLEIDSEYEFDDEIIVSYNKGATPIFNQSGNEIDPFDDYAIDNNIQNAGINTGIEANFKSLDVAVYPNPTNGIFHIKAANLSGDDCEITLYSMTGTTVSKKILAASFGNLEESVNVSHLKKGTYILHFICERQVYKDKLVVM